MSFHTARVITGQTHIAEVNQANKRNWDYRSCSQLLRPRHLLDGILGDELVPDEAVNLPRAGCSEIIIEKVSPRQRGVIPDKSFKCRVLPCKNPVTVGSAVVEMSVCIDDCCPAGERGSCHDRTASPSRQQTANLKPVTLPPGRARLATKPTPTGSPTAANTIGTVGAACFAAITAGGPPVTMMST